MTIHIIDDFLGDDFVEYMQDIIPDMPFQPMSADGMGESFLASIGQYPESDAFKFLAKKIHQVPKLMVQHVQTIYVNLNPTGINHCGKFHTDGGDITAMYYPYDWDEKYAGATLFEEGTRVEYVKNRLLLFDSNLSHRAEEHSNTNMFRYTVAVKMDARWNY